MKNRQWVLANRPQGELQADTFSARVDETPELAEGEALVKNLCFSFDPTQRGWINDAPGYMPPIQIGEVMRASSVGQVIESRSPALRVGDLVQGLGGWQEYYVGSAGAGLGALAPLPQGVSPEMALGLLGTTGLTAYFGLLDLAEPHEGDTVLVSGAAGATGSVVGQIAKIKGCRVIGIAGGQQKCQWLVEEAGFDDTIDYKSDNVHQRIGELCPAGMNIYFDNVGGAILEAALDHLAMNARVILCGGISGYNLDEPAPGPKNIMNLIMTRSRMEGFIVIDYFDRRDEFIKDMGQWIQEGKIVHLEDVQTGFENIPATLQRLFSGANTGKQLLKLADPDQLTSG